jgi:uncharacterized Zn finger protein
VHERRAAPLEVLALRRQQHERMPSVATYSALRGAADALGAWALERDAARQALRERDLGSFVDALLTEGDADTAWSAAIADPTWDPGLERRARIAEAREPTRPDDALSWYMLAVDEALLETGRPAYARAITILKRARRAAEAARKGESFAAQIAGLRERHRRRPTLIAMLDKAKLA